MRSGNSKMRNLQHCFVILLLVLLASCVATQPFPYAVRAGDTITLAIGSYDGVNKNNLSITYYPDPGSLPDETPVDVTSAIRSVFNIYPDKKSRTYWDKTSGNGQQTMAYVEGISGHSSWQTVVAVDLPSTLPTGTGHFVVTLGTGIITPPFLASVEDVNIQAQILEPGGEAHTFEFRKFNFNTETSVGNLTNLEQLRQVIVRKVPSQSSSSISVAAAEYNLLVPIIDEFSNDVSNLVPDSDIVVVLDDQINYYKNQTSLNWSRSGSSIKVITTSLSGNQNAKSIRFSILIANYTDAEANGWSLADTASLVTVKYFDLNGEELTGATPEVVVQ